MKCYGKGCEVEVGSRVICDEHADELDRHLRAEVSQSLGRVPTDAEMEEIMISILAKRPN